MGLEYSVPDDNVYAREHEECNGTLVMTETVEEVIKLRCKQQFHEEAVRHYGLISAEIQLAIVIFLSLLFILAIMALVFGYCVYQKKKMAAYYQYQAPPAQPEPEPENQELDPSWIESRHISPSIFSAKSPSNSSIPPV